MSSALVRLQLCLPVPSYWTASLSRAAACWSSGSVSFGLAFLRSAGAFKLERPLIAGSDAATICCRCCALGDLLWGAARQAAVPAPQVGTALVVRAHSTGPI